MDNQLSTLLKEILHSCSQCGKCQEECLFLREFHIEPREFTESLTDGGVDNLDLSLIFSCNLCKACEEICPEGIDLSRLFLLLREEQIKKEKNHLPAFAWVKERQDWINKGAFIYSQGERCESAFFPGCTLSGYSPHLVLETYAYLKKRHHPSTGIILNCCGAPFEGMGERDGLGNSLQTICSQIEGMGASHLIMACPTCYRVFSDYLPYYKLSTVYEIMEREGLPKIGRNSEEQFFLFHSCATRKKKEIQRAVRNVIEMMGYHVFENERQEAKIKCCGVGGMVGLNNPIMASIIAAERTEGISHSIVTYCVACREAMVQYRPSLHVLDLIFNPQWKQDQEKPPLEDSQKRENLAWIKSKLKQG